MSSTLGINTSVGSELSADNGGDEEIPTPLPKTFAKQASEVVGTMAEGARVIGESVGEAAKATGEFAVGFGKQAVHLVKGAIEQTPEFKAHLDEAMSRRWLVQGDLNIPTNALLAGAQPDVDYEPDRADHGGVLNRYLKNEAVKAQDSKLLSPEEANKLYPQMPTPYRAPVTEAVASYHAEEYDRRKAREDIIAKAPDYGTGGAIANMALDMGVSLPDPVNIVGMIAGGSLASGATKLGTFIPGAAKAATAIAESFPEISKLGYSLLHGTLSDLGFNVATEAGQQAINRSEQITPYTLRDSKEAIIQGLYLSPVFAGAHYGLGKLAGSKVSGTGELSPRGDGPSVPTERRVEPVPFISRAPEETAQIRMGRQLLETSPEIVPAIMKNAIENTAAGIRPDIEPVMKAVAQHTAVTEVQGIYSYVHEPVISEVPAGKKFYYATEGGNEPSAKRLFTSDSMGTGTHLTDNPLVANQTATRELSHGAGSVVTVESPKLKTFSLDETLTPASPEHGVFVSALEQTGMPHEDAMAVADRVSPKDIVEWLQDHKASDLDGDPRPIDTYQNGLRELGYEAVMHDGSKRMGFDHPEHNAIMLLDESKVPTGLDYHDANTSIRSNGNQAEITDARNRHDDLSRRWDLDASGAEQAKAKIQGVEFTVAHVENVAEANYKNTLEGLKSLDDQEILPPEFKKRLEELSKAETHQQIEESAIKALQWCLKG